MLGKKWASMYETRTLPCPLGDLIFLNKKELMLQQFNVSPTEAQRAKWPHEIFLGNLFFNHFFIFVATVSVAGFIPNLPALVPVISFCIIGYILIKLKQVPAGEDTWIIKEPENNGA